MFRYFNKNKNSSILTKSSEDIRAEQEERKMKLQKEKEELELKLQKEKEELEMFSKIYKEKIEEGFYRFMSFELNDDNITTCVIYNNQSHRMNLYKFLNYIDNGIVNTYKNKYYTVCTHEINGKKHLIIQLIRRLK